MSNKAFNARHGITVGATPVNLLDDTLARFDTPLQISNTTASTTSSTGALTVSGGVGIAGAVNVDSYLSVGGSIGVTGSVSIETGGLTVPEGTTTFQGIYQFVNSGGDPGRRFRINSTDDNKGINFYSSTSPYPQADIKVVFDGYQNYGGGVEYPLLISAAQGSITLQPDNNNSGDEFIFRKDFTNAESFADFPRLKITGTQASDASTSTSTGALVVTGGVGIGGSLNVGGNLNLTGELRGPGTFVIDPAGIGDNTGTVVIKGNLQIDGTTTTINSTTTTIDDLVLTLGGDTAPASDDTFDKGIEYRWFDTQARVGFFGFDRSTGKLTFIPQSTLSSGVYSGTTGEIDAKLDWSNVLNKPTINNTTYNQLAVTTTGGALLRLNSSGNTNDDVKFASGSNVTVAYTNDDTITISSTDTNTTYSIKASTQTNGAGLDLDAGGSGSGTDTVKILGSGATTVTRTDADTITISSTDTNTNTTYSVKASAQTGGASLDLDAGGSGSGTDSITFLGGGSTTVSRTDADTITISSTSVGDGTLSVATKSAGATNTDVTLELSGAYSANSSTNRTIKAVVGPALTALSTLMATAGAGFIKRGATADTYTIDTSTYLTSYSETDTLSSVTGRGATTATDITLGSGVATSTTNFGGTTVNYLIASTTGSLILKTKDQTTTYSRNVNIQTGNTTLAASNSGGILIKTGNATGGSGAYAGDISMYPGSSDGVAAIVSITSGESVSGTTSTGGYITIKGGSSTTTTGTTTANGGNVYIYGGDVTSGNNFTKNTGSIYMEGGGANGSGTITFGTINIGRTSASSSYGTSAVNIGNSSITVTLDGTIKLPTVGTSGLVRLGTGGQLSADTNTYLVGITGTSPISASSAVNGIITISHATSGVTAGTYNSVTVDAKGHVTGGTSNSYLTAEADTLATVTGRGNSTTNNVTFGTVDTVVSANSDVTMQITNNNTGGSATAQFFANNGTSRTQFFHTGTSYSGTGVLASAPNIGGIYNQSATGIALISSNAAGLIRFATGTSNVERVRIDSTGIRITSNAKFVSPDGTKTQTLRMLDTNTLTFSGSTGQLFSVSDSMSGSIFAVNDVSGIPSIEVFDTGKVQLAELSGNVLIGTSTDIGAKLQVNGDFYFAKSGDPRIYAGTNVGLNIDGQALYLNRYVNSTVDIGQGGGNTTIRNQLRMWPYPTGGYRWIDTFNNSMTNWQGTGSQQSTWGLAWRYNDSGNTRAMIAYDHAASEEFQIASGYGPIVFNVDWQNGHLDSPNEGTEALRLTNTYVSSTVNMGSTSSSVLNLATAGNTGTWIGAIQDGTSGWSLSGAAMGFKSDNTTYAAIGIATGNGILYFGRTTGSGVGTMSSWLEVDNGGVANFKRARPQYNGTNLVIASDVVSSIAGTSPISASASTGSVTISHATSGVTASTYNNVTVNSYGHVTGGSNVSYLTSYSETDTLATVTSRGYVATSYLNVPAGEGYGFCFWNDTTNYKISMGNTTGTYQYGPVTDYSIKMQMDGTAGRGFTWGVQGQKPIAALNSVSGNMQIAGSFSAASKSFLIPHPTKEGWKLRYGSLEGPENGVYIRGKLKGKNKIELPDYWTKLIDPDSITVTLTPIGKHQKLYVEDISNNVVTIANDGLFAGEINCFFVVYGERVDIDKLVVEYE